MTGSGATAAALLAAVGLVTWPGPTGLPRRTGRRPGGPVAERLRAFAPAIGAATAVTLIVPGWWWLGAVLGIAMVVGPSVRGPRIPMVEQVRLRAELAARLDLIAACLRAGLTVSVALAAVAQVCGDHGDPGPARPPARPSARPPARPLGRPGAGPPGGIEALTQVRSLLAIGADPENAWRPAAAHPELATVAAAACRSTTAGTGLAEAFAEQAAQARAANSDALVRSAGRAGVLITAPLGLCFLPAFLCLGLAPALLGLFDGLALW